MLPYLMHASVARRHASRRPLWATTPWALRALPVGNFLGGSRLAARLAITERQGSRRLPSLGATNARVRALMLVMLEEHPEEPR